MATVVCNLNCKYRNSVFCGKDFVKLNGAGACEVWYTKTGEMRRAPKYDDEAEQQATSK